jgi:hypothetical protein
MVDSSAKAEAHLPKLEESCHIRVFLSRGSANEDIAQELKNFA